MAGCLHPLRRAVEGYPLPTDVSPELLDGLDKLSCCAGEVYKSFISEYVDRALRLISALGEDRGCGSQSSIAELLSNLQSIVVDLSSVVRGELGVPLPDKVYRGLRRAQRALYTRRCNDLLRGVVESMDGLRELLTLMCGGASSY